MVKKQAIGKSLNGLNINYAEKVVKNRTRGKTKFDSCNRLIKECLDWVK